MRNIMPRHKKKARKKQRHKKTATGNQRKGWYQITFQLAGNLHVGSGRWGFVLPARPYLPGWTLWGALTAFLRQNRRWQGDWGDIGNRLNEECWLGHFFLLAPDPDKNLMYLPEMRAGRAIHYCWQDKKQPEKGTTNLPELRPMVFRHGVTRLSSGAADSQGRLFLHEMMRFDRNHPFRLQGLLYWKGNVNGQFPLARGDVLRIGGNRQVSGAEIFCDRIVSWKPRQHLVRHHLLYSEDSAAQVNGVLERIVLRRTRDTGKKAQGEFKGFGQHFVDWGDHLAPGWKMDGKDELQPVMGDEGFRHGTVRLKKY